MQTCEILGKRGPVRNEDAGGRSTGDTCLHQGQSHREGALEKRRTRVLQNFRKDISR